MFTPEQAARVLYGLTGGGAASEPGAWADTLTVAQLVERLQALPQDAKVGGLFDSEMGWGPVTAARPGGGPQWKADDSGWVTIVVDNQ